MVALKDITGLRFGRLTVVRRSDGRWRVVCDCGTLKSVRTGDLKTGNTQSCGCLNAELTRARKLTHGGSVGGRVSRTYSSWRNAKNRCLNRNDKKFALYGGRGITMCATWAGDFQAFLNDMGERPLGHTLDRINVDGNYELKNCRWATQVEQSQNRRNSILVMCDGAMMVLSEFAAHSGVNYRTLLHKVRDKGMSPYAAVASIKAR